MLGAVRESRGVYWFGPSAFCRKCARVCKGGIVIMLMEKKKVGIKGQIKEKDMPVIAAKGGNILMRHAGQVIEGRIIDYKVTMTVGEPSISGMSFTFNAFMQTICATDVAKDRALADEIVLISKELYDSVGDKK